MVQINNQDFQKLIKEYDTIIQKKNVEIWELKEYIKKLEAKEVK
jgi:hypothetical protein